MTATRYLVDGMTCDHCVSAVTSEVTAVPGVSGVEVDLPTASVLVQGESLDDAAIRSAIEEAGYSARA